jgi:hypothetical protein
LADSLTEAFPAAEARWLVERLEWHFTRKHSSGLNMAASELRVLASQCLSSTKSTHDGTTAAGTTPRQTGNKARDGGVKHQRRTESALR